MNTSRVPSSQHQSVSCSGTHCRSWSAMACSSCGVTLPDSHFHGRKSFPSGSAYSGWHSCISPEKGIPFCRQKQKYAASTCCRSFSSVPNRRHTFRSAVRAMPPSSRLHLHSSQLSVLPSSAEKPPETGCSRYAANRFSKYSIPNRVSRKVQSFAWEKSCSFRLSYSSRRNCPSASVRSAASESVFKWLTEGISPPTQRKSCRRNCASNILLYA